MKLLTVSLIALSAVVAAGHPLRRCYSPKGRPHSYHCEGLCTMPSWVPADTVALNMSGSRVRRIDGAALARAGASRVSMFYFSGNDIHALYSNDTCGLDGMKTLDLSANNLLTIDADALECNPRLKRLALSDNPKLQLPPLSSSSLSEIFLDGLDLSWFDAESLVHLPSLRVLYVRDVLGLSCSRLQNDLDRLGLHHVELVCTEAATQPSKPGGATTKPTPPAPSVAELTPSVPSDTASQPDQPPASTPDPLGLALVVLTSIPVTLIVLLFVFVCHYCWKNRRNANDLEPQSNYSYVPANY